MQSENVSYWVMKERQAYRHTHVQDIDLSSKTLNGEVSTKNIQLKNTAKY